MRAKNYYPPTTKIKNQSGSGAIRTFILTCLLMIGFTAASYAANPTYILPSPQSITMCQDGGVYNFESLLTANDIDLGETLTWSIAGPTPIHGQVLFSGNTASSGFGPVTPTSFTYTPNAGESGTDAINILVNDGVNSAIMTINVTINPLPSAITGPTTVCRTQSIQLAATPAGGTWSSNNAEATVDLNTGVVTGAGAANGGVQSSVISYTNSTTGCVRTTTITINRLSEINVAPASLCAYSGTAAATNATFGGAWSSTVAPVTPTGLGNNATVTAQGPGTALITYTMPSGCRDTASVVINPLPQAIIVGTVSNVCETFTISFSDQTPGGTWSVDNGSVATVNTTGNVTGINFGATTLSYTLPTGCATSVPVTVNQVPVIGTGNACIGQPINLSVTPGGGTWTTSDTNISISGNDVTGSSAGTANVTYTTAAGCVSSASLTINPVPGAISGITTLCQGSTVTLSNATAAGTWSNTNGNVSVDPNTGVVTGVSGGTDIVSYILTTGCYATTNVTVNPISAVDGPDHVCKGATVTLFLNPFMTGGTWSSSNANATIDNDGNVTGVDVGTTTITYSTGAGCFATRTQFIDSLPNPIIGATTVCNGSTTTLSNAGGGVWTSNNSGIAAIDFNTGEVTGNSAGDAVITYALPFPSTCITTTTVTVHPNDPIIGGGVELCIGTTVALSNPNAGGTWSASNATSTVDASTGVVTAVSPGLDTVTYTTTFGCTSTTEILVNPNPDTISGVKFDVCEGLTISLFNATPGGAWSTADALIADVDGSGVVTGVSGGVVDITYTMPSGCFVTRAITVNPLGELSGIPYVCIGSVQPLFAVPTGGNWLVDVADIAIAQVGFTNGQVQGISNGVATIDYITTAGCVSTIEVTVGVAPPVVAVTSTDVCEGSTITLKDTVGGGVWTSSDNSVATVAASGSGVGVVTGVTAGNADITYTLATGCFSVINVTVNPVPVIPVSNDVCQISTINLSEPGGGLWSTTDTNIFIDPFFGVVLGITPGPATVTYTFTGTGCFSTTSITVNPVPEAISGNMVLCPGVSTLLSDPTPGGTWSSTSTATATIDAVTGLVTGVAPGISIISYTLSTGCAAISAVVVNNTLLTPITGPASVCMGQQIDLDQLALGGTWSSMDASVGTVDPVTGVVTGVSAGTTIITYELSNTCSGIHSVEVFELTPTMGDTTICVGSSDTLTNATFGGSWASTDGSIAVVDALTGIVTGVSAGTVTIEYILPSGCVDTFNLTVNPIPTAITGVNPGVCMGDSILLTNGVAGGTWTSSDLSVATIDTNTGWAYSVAPGVTVITYALPTGCGPRTDTLSVNPLPTLTSPHNPPAVCNNATFSYIPTTSPGVITFQWQRLSNPRISNPLNTGSVSISEVLNNTTPDTANVYYAVVLYDTNSTCATNDTIMVVVNPTPRLASTATSNVCDSSLFEFISTSATPNVTYSWFRGAVTGISNAAASGTGDTIREYLKNTTVNQIVVTYLDTLWFDGCWHVDTVKVTVNPTPRLSTPLNAGAICDSATFVYTSSSFTPSVTYTWHRPAKAGIANAAASGTGNVISEQLFNTTANPITVNYLDTLWFDGCWHVDTVKVVVNPTPKLNSGLTPPAICDSVLFSYNPTSATAGSVFTWVRNYTPGIDLLAGSGTGNPNEVLVNTSNIDITVTYHYTITANGCSHNQNVLVVVHPRPRLSSDPGPLSVCSGTTFVYFPTGYVLGTSFAWSRPQVAGVSPNTGSGTGQITEVLIDSLLVPKTVTYKIVMTASGCKDSAYVAVDVHPSYILPEIKTNTPSEVCLGTNNQLFWLETPAPVGVTYYWSGKNAKVKSTGNPDQYALVDFDSSAGPAWITVTSNVTGFACYNNSRSIYLNVKSSRADVMQIIYNNGIFKCLNNDQDTYQWGYDDAITLASTSLAGETNQYYFNNGPDFVYRRYWCNTTHNGCTQKTYFNAPLAVNDITDAMEVKVYPNPTTDILNVDINTKAGGKFEIEVVDVLGQRINTVTPVNHRATINVAGLAPGVYMVECYRDGVKFNASRFIKN